VKNKNPEKSWILFIYGAGFSYPCLGTITALRGYDGAVLWETDVRSQMLFFNCEEVDVDRDGAVDCIATGRMGAVTAFNPRTGS